MSDDSTASSTDASLRPQLLKSASGWDDSSLLLEYESGSVFASSFDDIRANTSLTTHQHRFDEADLEDALHAVEIVSNLMVESVSCDDGHDCAKHVCRGSSEPTCVIHGGQGTLFSPSNYCKVWARVEGTMNMAVKGEIERLTLTKVEGTEPPEGFVEKKVGNGVFAWLLQAHGLGRRRRKRTPKPPVIKNPPPLICTYVMSKFGPQRANIMLRHSVSYHTSDGSLITTGPKLPCGDVHCRRREWIPMGGCNCSSATVHGAVYMRTLDYATAPGMSGQFQEKRTIPRPPFVHATERIIPIIERARRENRKVSGRSKYIAALSGCEARDIDFVVKAQNPTRTEVRSVKLSSKLYSAQIVDPGVITVDAYMRVIHISEARAHSVVTYKVRCLINVPLVFLFYVVNNKYGTRQLCYGPSSMLRSSVC